jgi:predicted nucleic acid-binding protein
MGEPGVHPFDYVIRKVPWFGGVKADLRKKGSLIEDLDLLIAATARTYDLTLVTNDEGHVGPIPGLRLTNWVESYLSSSPGSSRLSD